VRRFSNNMATNAGAVMLMVPLAIDCGFALSDNTRRQAYMTIARTMIISTRRATLDIKVKRLLAQLRRRKIKIV